MSSWLYHRDLAEAHYQRYAELQEEIADVWKAARAAAQGSKRAAWVILLKQDTQHGFNYMRLTDERTQLIQQITMHSSMATMFWMTEPDQPARIPTQVDRTLES